MGLDTILQATESLEQSYISPPSYLPPTRDHSIYDNTDFVFVFPVERLSANAFFFDGLDSGADTQNVTITGTFVVDKDGNKVDNYTFLNRNDNRVVSNESYNRTPPIMCLVTDTFGYLLHIMVEQWNITQKKLGKNCLKKEIHQYINDFCQNILQNTLSSRLIN
jgi:hypothetical protein